jgi:hypothetical protein
MGVSRAGMTGVHGAGNPPIAVEAAEVARKGRNAMRTAVSKARTTNETYVAARGDRTAAMKTTTGVPTKAAKAGAVTLECRNGIKAVVSKVVRTIEVPAAARDDQMAAMRTMITVDPADPADSVEPTHACRNATRTVVSKVRTIDVRVAGVDRTAGMKKMTTGNPVHGCRVETSMDTLRAMMKIEPGRAVKAARTIGTKMTITRTTANPAATTENAEPAHGCRIETSMEGLRATTIKAGRAVRAAQTTGTKMKMMTRITDNPVDPAESAEVMHGCRIGTSMDASKTARTSEAMRVAPTIRTKMTTGNPAEREAGGALQPWMKTNDEKSHHVAGGLIHAGNSQ